MRLVMQLDCLLEASELSLADGINKTVLLVPMRGSSPKYVDFLYYAGSNDNWYKEVFSCRLSLRKRQEMKFSHNVWGLGSSQDIRCHIRSCDSVFVSCHTKQQHETNIGTYSL